jgi:hypothetical protein
MDAEDWLLDTERKLNTVNYSNGEKIRYVMHLLCGPAAAWWDNVVAIHLPAECSPRRSSRKSSGRLMCQKASWS